MIIYGALLNSYNLYATADLFTIYGAIRTEAGPEVEFNFPVFGPVYKEIKVATSFSIMGPIVKTTEAPVHFSILGSIYKTKVSPRFSLLGAIYHSKKPYDKIVIRGGIVKSVSRFINITGLNISDIAISKTFTTPSLLYSIYPFHISDIKEVLGTNLPYQIIGTDLIFSTLPTGPITLVPYSRLKVYTNEIKKLIITNTIPDKLEFTDITVSGDFELSLYETGPWDNTLDVLDSFYIKAPDLSAVGSDYSKIITITAKATPIG